MVNDYSITAPLRKHCRTDAGRIVNIKVWFFPNRNIGKAFLAQAVCLSGQKLQAPMRAEMHPCIRAETICRIKISSQILMRRRASRILQYFADFSGTFRAITAAFGLDEQKHIAKAHACDQNLSAKHHRFSGQASPCFLHARACAFRYSCIKPRIFLRRHCI